MNIIINVHYTIILINVRILKLSHFLDSYEL